MVRGNGKTIVEGEVLTINYARVGGADAIFHVCRRILIDAGEPNRPDYIELLHHTLSDLKARVQRILVTHWHLDHIGGVEGVCGLHTGEYFERGVHNDTQGCHWWLHCHVMNRKLSAVCSPTSVLTFINRGSMVLRFIFNRPCHDDT